MRATCLIKVDLPPIFGPVSKRILGCSSSPIKVSFGTKLSTFVMHGCLPSLIAILGYKMLH